MSIHATVYCLNRPKDDNEVSWFETDEVPVPGDRLSVSSEDWGPYKHYRVVERRFGVKNYGRMDTVELYVKYCDKNGKDI